MPLHHPLACLVALFLACAALGAGAAPFPEGRSERMLAVGEETLQIHAYKPPGYDRGPILLVLHGLGRNAPGYRDYARPLADRYGYLVIAPLFDRERFPTWRYQQGGIARVRDGIVTAHSVEDHFGRVLDGVVEAVRQAEAAPALPYAVVGHSAGGQALSRYAAFTATQAQRIVIANPSTWFWPSPEVRYPYGYGGLPAALADDAALRRYLAQPLVVLLGTADVRRDPDLNVRPGALAQGDNRYERGLNFFRAGERLARERGWTFAWQLVEVPGVGHSARRMLASDAAMRIFGD